MSRNHIYAEYDLQSLVDHTLSYNHGRSRRSSLQKSSEFLTLEISRYWFWMLRDYFCVSKIIPSCGVELWPASEYQLFNKKKKKKLESFVGKVVAVFGDPEQSRKNNRAPQTPNKSMRSVIVRECTRSPNCTFSLFHCTRGNQKTPPSPQIHRVWLVITVQCNLILCLGAFWHFSII